MGSLLLCKPGVEESSGQFDGSFQNFVRTEKEIHQQLSRFGDSGQCVAVLVGSVFCCRSFGSECASRMACLNSWAAAGTGKESRKVQPCRLSFWEAEAPSGRCYYCGSSQSCYAKIHDLGGVVDATLRRQSNN